MIKRLGKKIIKRLVMNAITNDNNKRELIDLLNDKINIPKLTEKEEDKLFERVYNVFSEYICLIIDRI